MKESKLITKAANVTAVDFGKLNEIKDYTLQLGPEVTIPGKAAPCATMAQNLS